MGHGTRKNQHEEVKYNPPGMLAPRRCPIEAHWPDMYILWEKLGWKGVSRKENVEALFFSSNLRPSPVCRATGNQPGSSSPGGMWGPYKSLLPPGQLKPFYEGPRTLQIPYAKFSNRALSKTQTISLIYFFLKLSFKFNMHLNSGETWTTCF